MSTTHAKENTVVLFGCSHNRTYGFIGPIILCGIQRVGGIGREVLKNLEPPTNKLPNTETSYNKGPKQRDMPYKYAQLKSNLQEPGFSELFRLSQHNPVFGGSTVVIYAKYI